MSILILARFRNVSLLQFSRKLYGASITFSIFFITLLILFGFSFTWLDQLYPMDIKGPTPLYVTLLGITFVVLSGLMTSAAFHYRKQSVVNCRKV